MPARTRRADKTQEEVIGRLTALGYASGGAPTQTAPASRDPKLATNGTLKIDAKDVESAARDVGRLAVDAGGFIGSAISGRDAAGCLYATLSMRIPTARVPSVLESLRALGKVTQETLTTDDVSKTVFDLQTRLRVKGGTEERLHGLFASRTGKLGDVIDVEKELERVVGEIEEIEGQQTRLPRSARRSARRARRSCRRWPRQSTWPHSCCRGWSLRRLLGSSCDGPGRRCGAGSPRVPGAVSDRPALGDGPKYSPHGRSSLG
jgi:hypothetical protein